MNPDEVLAIWKAEFDVAYEERTLFILTMRPHIIGHRSRVVMLDQLIAQMRSKRGVWFATHEQIARVPHDSAWRLLVGSLSPLAVTRLGVVGPTEAPNAGLSSSCRKPRFCSVVQTVA